MKVILAVVIARMCSGFYNFYLNRKLSFKSKNKTIPDMVRYLILFFTQMAASAGFVIMISSFGITEQISKLLVDTTLFFISYRIQKNWVFAEKGKGDDLKQKEKRRIRFNIYGIVYGFVLFSYTVYTLLYTFVLPQKSVKLSDVTGNSQLSVSDTTTMVSKSDSTTENSDETVATDTTYESSTLSVTIDTIRRYDTTIYVADVVVKDASVLQSGLAEDTFGKNIKETTSEIADYYGAILAINGDYYGFRDEGYVMRNGYLYRSEAASGDDNEDLVVYEDGSFEIINESEVTAEELQAAGATQIYSFGPGLIIDGEVVVDEDTEVDRAMGSNPRTAIGMVEPLHYILVVSDGRTDESEGLTLDELAEVMADYGCTQAYNLDGGGSSTMVFNGTVINNPTSNGRSEKERSVSDIVYFK
jgi:exopolysaccharide biosynthesis protein